MSTSGGSALALVLILCAAAWLLGGCAQIQGDIAADAASASAVATAIGRPQDVPCFTAIGALAGAAKGAPFPALLTKTEIVLGSQALAQGPCAPIIGAVALTVLRHAPIPIP